MRNILAGTSERRGIMALGLLSLVLMIFVGQPVLAENLEELLQQVGEEYAVSYSSPFLYAFGPNQNSGMYQTASIPWGGLTFGFGVKVMATHLNEDDQNFAKNIENVNLGDFDPAYEGQYGDVIMSGPTIFGNTDEMGTVKGYLHGIEVFSNDAIPGLVESRFVPLAAPEAYVGGIFGLKATVRYFPELEMGEYGKTKYFGYGLQWSPNGLMPTFPVDLMVGFFDQELSVGSLLQTNATTYFIGASKEFSKLTLYGGYAKDESDMSVSYEYLDEGIDISFDVEARQDSHLTVGVAFNFLLGLNLEMNAGDLITYSSGLMIGF